MPQPEMETPQSQHKRMQERVTILGQAELATSCKIVFGQENYLTVDYIPDPDDLRLKSKRSGATAGAEASRGGREGSTPQSQSRSRLLRASSRLRVFVNDPGRTGRPALSMELDLCQHVKMEG